MKRTRYPLLPIKRARQTWLRLLSLSIDSLRICELHPGPLKCPSAWGRGSSLASQNQRLVVFQRMLSLAQGSNSGWWCKSKIKRRRLLLKLKRMSLLTASSSSHSMKITRSTQTGKKDPRLSYATLMRCFTNQWLMSHKAHTLSCFVIWVSMSFFGTIGATVSRQESRHRRISSPISTKCTIT